MFVFVVEKMNVDSVYNLEHLRLRHAFKASRDVWMRTNEARKFYVPK